MEYDKHNLNSHDVMGISWKLINKDLGKDHKNDGTQSVNIDSRSSANQQIIAHAFYKHFTTIPNMINNT